MNRIEMFKTDGGFTVIVDDLFADHLAVDEALAVVASAMFKEAPHHYLMTYKEWDRRDRRWHPFREEPVGLLPAKPSNLIQGAIHGIHG